MVSGSRTERRELHRRKLPLHLRAVHRSITQERIEHVRGAGAILPQELFVKILDALPDGKQEIKENRLSPVQNCSLVCVYWAQICRARFFGSAYLRVNSYKDAEVLRQLVAQGSSRLTPLVDLIAGIRIRQAYDHPSSFVHLCNHPSMRNKIRRLYIDGAAPERFPVFPRDTPFWGITNIAAPSLPITGVGFVTIRSVRLPSFACVRKYLWHFRRWHHSLHISSVTWDDGLPTFASVRPRAFVRAPSDAYPKYVTAGDCTDSLAVCWQAAMTSSDFPLCRISEENQHRVMSLLRPLHELLEPYRGETVIGMPECPTRDRWILHVVWAPDLDYNLMIEFTTRSMQGNNDHATLQPVRVSVCFGIDEAVASDRLLSEISIIQTIFAASAWLSPNTEVVLAFTDYATLQTKVQLQPELTTVATYRFICKRSEKYPFPHVQDLWDDTDWIAINPQTLEPMTTRPSLQTGPPWIPDLKGL